MKVHELKCWPEPFEALRWGTKTHEYRRDDRAYAVGDILDLREWDPEVEDFTMCIPEQRLVTYITSPPARRTGRR